MNSLDSALDAWRAGAAFRRRRSRYKDYTYGRQWSDMTVDARGLPVTEAEQAENTGFRPMSNNLIRQLVKCVIGNFRMSLREADPAMVAAAVDGETAARNALTEIDCRMLEEFLISGCAVQRVVMERRMAGQGVWVDNVSPADFFVNRFTDPRGLDIELIGMLHSMSLREVLMRFAPRGGAAAARISRIYGPAADRGYFAGFGDTSDGHFFEAPSGRCRVIEVWTLESRDMFRCHDTATGAFFMARGADGARLRSESERRDREGEPQLLTRRAATLRWHCRFLSPSGDVLDDYDSPYRHGLHPFAVKFYPLIDGEVHSLVEDIIDQQRCVNRLITLIDHIMSVSAKGALLMPVGSLAPGMTAADVGRLWAQCGSIIPYNPAKGEPRQLVASGDNAGAYQLLDLQMRMFQEISGVSGALQGHLAGGNTSAAMYDAQVRNSAVAILDLMQSFNAFRTARNSLIVGS